MADSKITALTALTAADPANDMIPIVDVSDTPPASGNTKRISINNILACSPSATLASATITGDLTVDTTTLKVDSTNNRVGINNATPGVAFHIGTTSGTNKFCINTAFTSGGDIQMRRGSFLGFSNAADNANSEYMFANGGALEFGIGGSTAMTLNSTGLGVGGAPSDGRLLTIGSLSSVSATASAINIYSSKATLNITADGATNAAGTTISYSWANGGQGPLIFRNASIANVMTLDASGNVGVGVTPSAWGSNSKALQVGGGTASVSSTGAGSTASRFAHGAYFDNTNWLYQYTGVGPALYQVTGANAGSTHAWYTSAGGTAGNTITDFATAKMTLDASGNLLVGKAALSDTTVGWYVRPNGITTATMSSSVNTDTSYQLYSTGASAYRFYVGMGGTVYATNTTISAISDARLKENVQDIDVGLDAILALKPRKFDWKTGKGKNIKGDRGFIAQEFETVFPNLIDEWKDPAPEGEAPYKSVRQVQRIESPKRDDDLVTVLQQDEEVVLLKQIPAQDR